MLDVSELFISYDQKTVVSDASFTVRNGELVAILGPSGAGKSSLLRAIAGLVTPDRGSIFWDTTDMSPVPTHEREFGFMFQDYALFPHLSVGRNVAYGLAMAGEDADEQLRRTREVLGWVGMADFAHRSVETLSGGEQQRVALARALAPSPRLLMLDEPVGSLDRVLRQRLTSELRSVLRDQQVTALYVTHDQDEAFELADRIIVMRDGAIEQTGTPQEVWEHPKNRWMAEFLGVGSVVMLEGRLVVVRRDAISLGGPTNATVIQSTFRGGRCEAIIRLEDSVELTVDLPIAVYEAGSQLAITIDRSRVIGLQA